MQPARFKPAAQVFVCVNVRAGSDPLRSGCGAAGPGVYAALKRAVGAAGRASDVWVTRTHCLGHCPASGCAVAAFPGNAQWVGVTEHDAPEILARAVSAAVR